MSIMKICQVDDMTLGWEEASIRKECKNILLLLLVTKFEQCT